MSSRKPPSQRDPEYAAARYGRALQSMAPGTLQGRVANASPIKNNVAVVSGGGTGSEVGPGLTIAYTENLAAVTVTTTANSMMTLGVTTSEVSNAVAGINLNGVSSAEQNLRVEVMHSGSVATSFLFHLDAGPNVVGVPFILQGVPKESASWALRMRVDVGTFAMASSASSWWIESGAIEGGLTARDPSSTVLEPVDDSPITVSESNSIAAVIPIGATVSEPVNDHPISVTEAITLRLANTLYPTVSADDGYYTSGVGFNNAGTIAYVGSSGSETRNSFFRFDLPQDLGGATIDDAWLDLVADSNMASIVQLRVDAEYTPHAVTVTSRADAESRTRTVAKLDTGVTLVAGQTISFNVKNVVAEIAAGSPYGGFDSLLLFVADRGSATDVLGSFRTSETTAGSTHRPALRLTFHNIVTYGYYAGFAGSY